MCRSAVHDGSCSPWVMCSCRVVRGDQIRDIIIRYKLLSFYIIIMIYQRMFFLGNVLP